MSAHDHRAYVAGCFRCDLSREEVATKAAGDAQEARCGSNRRSVEPESVPEVSGAQIGDLG